MIETVRAERYTWWRAIRSSSLSATARHVAFTLSSYMDKDGGGAWPALSTLATDTGRSVATVKRALAELVGAGFLERESGGGRRSDGGYVSTRYRAMVPTSWLMGEPDEEPGNGLTDEPDTYETDELAGASGEGAGSSQLSTGSSETGNGLTGEPRSTQELALQSSNQEPIASDFVDTKQTTTITRINDDRLNELRDIVAKEAGYDDFRTAPTIARNWLDPRAHDRARHEAGAA